jgi:hypothetical protein
VANREAGEGQQFVGCVTEHRLELGELAAKHPSDDIELLVDMGGVGLGEDGPDRGGDYLRRALGHPGENVPEEVKLAALNGRAGHDRLDGLAQAQVGIGDDQLNP